MKTLILAACLLASSVLAQAVQTATPTQQTSTHADAMTTTNATAAINTIATVTISAPQQGFSIYVCEIDLSVTNDATGAVVATNAAFTTTNLGGWQYKYSMVGTANTVGVDRSWNFAPGCIKATTGSSVTIVSPAANAHAIYNINAVYYVAP